MQFYSISCIWSNWILLVSLFVVSLFHLYALQIHKSWNRPKHIFLVCICVLLTSVSVLLSNATSQPTHFSINKNAAILPQVPPSALNHTPCSPVRRELLSHDGQLCSPVQCCVCVRSGLWLSLSLSWIRPVMMNEACNITNLAGISWTRQCPHSCAKLTSFLHKHMLSVLAQRLMGEISCWHHWAFAHKKVRLGGF